MLQKIKVDTPSGMLQTEFSLPDKDYSKNCVAIICHPHPLYQGTMHNKVVTSLSKVFNNLKIPSIRFNYRGVGESDGSYGDIVGEVEDCQSILDWVKTKFPSAKFIFSGFSFGAYIAAKVCANNLQDALHLCTIAPSVVNMPFHDLPHVSCPWVTVLAEADEIVDPSAILAWYNALQAHKSIIKFPATTHFFHGKLIELQDKLQDYFHASGIDL